MPRQLTISSKSSTPFKSSYLAIPPTPFSPRLPLNQPAPLPAQHRLSVVAKHNTRLNAAIALNPPPPESLHWLWQCHKCNRVYKLSVTRRCLDDGHLFCAGITTIKRRVRRHQACASEFDYSGWKAWGTWRRKVLGRVEEAESLEEEGEVMIGIETPDVRGNGDRWSRMREEVVRARKYWERNDVSAAKEGGGNKKKKKDCWKKCDYPSECRWGKQYGVKTPTLPSVQITSFAATMASVTDDNMQNITDAQKPKVTFDEILLDISDQPSPNYLEPLEAETSCLNFGGKDIKDVTEGETHLPSIEQLVNSAKRREHRKHKSQNGLPLIPSPLAASSPSPGRETIPKPVFPSGFQKAVDDFELDIKRNFDLAALQQRADALIQSVKATRAKFQT